MLRLFYTLLTYLLQPIILLIMWKRSLKLPAYAQRLNERYGYYRSLQAPKKGGIVVHAASVGEVIAATPLIRALQQRYPDLAITVTTVTPTGSTRVKAAFGESVSHFYLPYDLPDAIRRFLAFVQPKVFIVIETELWPNLIYEIDHQNIPFIIANARLSPRSAKRYGWIKLSLKKMWAQIDLIAAQDQVSADRYLNLGFNATRLVNTGNLKFDLSVTDAQHQKVRETAAYLGISQRPVWIAASTHEGEERMALDAHRELLTAYPDLVLILVPRHPERFEAVGNLIEKLGFPFVRRSSNQPLSSTDQVLFGDTMGEMMVLYGLAQVAFVGGSLVKHGGHNPLEPIAFHLPVISGIHTYNFPEVFSKLRAVDGVIEIPTSTVALAQAVSQLLASPSFCQKLSSAGFAVLNENQGALKRHLDLLAPYVEKPNE